MKIIKLYTKLCAIFITYWGLEGGYIAVRDLGTLNFLNPWLYAVFLVPALPFLLVSIPLWYYGFKKKD